MLKILVWQLPGWPDLFSRPAQEDSTATKNCGKKDWKTTFNNANKARANKRGASNNTKQNK